MNAKPWARLDSASEKNIKRTVKLQRQGEVLNKEFIIDGVTKKRLNASTTLPVVLFEPNHLQLISGDPQLRRDFLDELGVHILPAAVMTTRSYKRALAQRNSLLKQAAHADRFFVWDVRLAELADTIVNLRNQAIGRVNSRLLKVYRELGGKAKSLEAVYESRFNSQNYGEALMKYLAEHIDRDKERGFTSQGPHRDDVVFLFDGIDARERASRGEARTLLLALKIIEMELAAEQAEPLLLLDDVFSELDGHRRKALAERLKGYQTFITTTDADVAIENFQDKATIIPLSRKTSP
jgi:DNA replication and repair protein RecF